MNRKQKKRTSFLSSRLRSNPYSHYCSAINCYNTRERNPGLSFFRFPKDQKRCDLWIQYSRREKSSAEYCYKNLTLCANHFEDEMFTNPQKKSRLTQNAVPRLFDVPNLPKVKARRQLIQPAPEPKAVSPPPQFEANLIQKSPGNDISPSTFPSNEKYTLKGTPRRERLRNCLRSKNAQLKQKSRAIRSLQRQVDKFKKVDGLIEATKAFLTEDEHNLVAAQLRLSVKKRRVYSDEFKAFAISIYYKSPSCYRFLQTRMKLPSKSTINLWLSKLHFEEGLCPNLLKMLTLRVSRLKVDDRDCVLIADEISLKESVDYCASDDRVYGLGEQDEILNGACVFMVAGLKKKWKQTVSFYFVQASMPSGELENVLRKTLDELATSGLRVHAFSSDQGSNFSSLMSSLGVSRGKPCFEHNGQKIFYIADPPHVLKSTRNCLLKHTIESSTGTAKWSVIMDLYNLDKKQLIRLCPKLRDAHFNMRPFGAKMKVRWAAQVRHLIV